MADLIFKNDEGEIKFYTRAFLDTQHQIAMKYETENGINFDFIGETIWTKKFDAYLLHALEECSEAYEELKKWDVLTQNNPKELIEEIIDVIMYLGSLDLLLDRNCNNEYYRFSDTMYIKYYTTLNVSLLENNYENAKLALLEIISQVTMLRRNYPARKWHKHKLSDDRDLSDVELSLYETRVKILEIISNLLCLALSINGHDEERLDDVLVKKQKKVLGLK